MIKFFLSFSQRSRVFVDILYLAVVAWISMMPFNEIPHWALTSGFDILVHISMYFGLTILACWTFRIEQNRRRIIYIVLFALSLGMMMEIWQMLVKAGRDFEWSDEFSNLIGTLIGAGTYSRIVKYYRKSL